MLLSIPADDATLGIGPRPDSDGRRCPGCDEWMRPAAVPSGELFLRCPTCRLAAI